MSGAVDALRRGKADAALAQMWAKTGPLGTWHRLAYHMLDVAAVARLLLERHVPLFLRARFAARLGVCPEDFEAWVVFLAALHDVGKATPPFQIKFPERTPALVAAGLPFPRKNADTPHGRMTAALETRRRLEARGWHDDLAQQAVRWVGGHHGVFPTDLQLLRAGDDMGAGPWVDARHALFERLATLLAPASAPSANQTVADVGIFVAGLTSVADWIGSMSQHFAFETTELAFDDYFERALNIADVALEQVGWRRWQTGSARTFEALFQFSPRLLQRAIATVVSKAKEQLFAIVEAPMGEGKTEAAFWVAHELGRRADHRGTYFALPTMATANQMFGRTRRFLEASYQGRLALHLLHGGADFTEEFVQLRAVVDDDAPGQPLANATNCGTVVAEEWFSKRKRGLLAPFAVGTIDQALLGVMRTRHGFVRLFGLSGKTVVLDEVHAYDAYTSRILDRLVAWLRRLGASVVILSATLPRHRREQLCGQWASGAFATAPYPRITAFTDDTPCVEALPQSESRRVVLEQINGDLGGALSWLIGRIERGGCAGLIVNTVARAQEAALLARARWGDVEVLLLHARFFALDRQARERRLLAALGRDGQRPPRLLVIGTQVLEQSLDIDFDVLATDLAPVDLMLQRTGRLHRHERLRPPGLESPTLGILSPGSVDDGGPQFGVHGLIYEEAILLRTWAVLEDRLHVELPADIELLIELVYGSARPLAPDPIAARMSSLDAELATAIDETERDAEDRLLASPSMTVDDPFANFGLPLDEDNPDLAKALQAVTRLGEPSVQVAFLTDASMLARPPNREESKQVVQRTLSLSNESIVFELRRQPPPPAWENVAMLRRTRALVLEGCRVRVGTKELVDDPELGLVISNSSEEDT